MAPRRARGPSILNSIVPRAERGQCARELPLPSRPSTDGSLWVLPIVSRLNGPVWPLPRRVVDTTSRCHECGRPLTPATGVLRGVCCTQLNAHGTHPVRCGQSGRHLLGVGRAAKTVGGGGVGGCGRSSSYLVCTRDDSIFPHGHTRGGGVGEWGGDETFFSRPHGHDPATAPRPLKPCVTLAASAGGV